MKDAKFWFGVQFPCKSSEIAHQGSLVYVHHCTQFGVNQSLSVFAFDSDSYNAGFRLTCRLPHCRFDDDICSTAQAPLAAEG